MDRAQVFEEVRRRIAAGRHQETAPLVLGIAMDAEDEPLVLLTCLSLLKTIGEPAAETEVLEMITGRPAGDPAVRLETARGLRGLGLHPEACGILGDDTGDDAERERMAALRGLDDHAGAVAAYRRIGDPDIDDDVLAADCLCSLGDYADAAAIADRLMGSRPSDLRAQKCNCTVMMRRGRSREAGDFVKGILKRDKHSADANALAAYFMWMSGRIAAAGGYASKAVKADPGNVDAMEVLAFCLVGKGKRDQARVVAGAINERSPGHEAVMRILEACR